MTRWFRKFFPNRTDPKSIAMLKFNDCVSALSPDSIAIDCGANVGTYSVAMAAKGAQVYSFEPNRYAYAELVQATKGMNVKCFQKAVSDRAGEVKLYLHENANEDPVRWSTGSSLLPFKSNVKGEEFEIVEAIDLVDFLNEIDKPIALMKMDVEGAEVSILKRLIDSGWASKIDSIFVETHDDKIPELRESTSQLRESILKNNLTNINLDWQ